MIVVHYFQYRWRALSYVFSDAVISFMAVFPMGMLFFSANKEDMAAQLGIVRSFAPDVVGARFGMLLGVFLMVFVVLSLSTWHKYENELENELEDEV